MTNPKQGPQPLDGFRKLFLGADVFCGEEPVISASTIPLLSLSLSSFSSHIQMNVMLYTFWL